MAVRHTFRRRPIIRIRKFVVMGKVTGQQYQRAVAGSMGVLNGDTYRKLKATRKVEGEI